MSTVLALDTSTLSLALAIVRLDREPRVIAARDRGPGPSHSTLLPALVAEALEEAGLSIGDLDGVCVGLGPGTFTGLRIALSTAKGLCYAARLPLAGASGLAAMARAAAKRAPAAGAIVPLLDARKGEVYAGFHAASGEPLGAEVALSPERLASKLAELPGPVVLLGEGHLAHRAGLDAATAGRRLDVPDLPETPPALELAELAAPRLGAYRSGAIFALEPTYLRSTDRELSLGAPV